ncbi:MAG: nitronate monooxygenase [Pseudomonadales bacterium]
MKTRITDLFDIEHPIIQGDMHFVGLAELAAAVSNAGGLGIITGLTQGTPEKLANDEDMIDEVAGVYPRIMQEGDMDAGAWSCGMVAGLINNIPTVQELIDTIMAEADAIINDRFKRMA